jgi:LPXTG-motif cell wall-anchored protein
MPAQPPAEARPRPTPAATARPQATPPRPAAATPPGGNGLFSLQNIAVGAVGLLLVVAAGVFFVRRRNAAEVVDASAFDNPLGDDENPFAGLDAGADVEAETEEIPISQAARAEVGIPLDEDEGPPSAKPRSAQEGKKMDMTSDNAQTTLLDSSPMAAGMAGGGDAARMIAEFERRMAAMETRIDELVDAKERLERQVAAQTEELRVQRAAIARTQRAVRNLSRPGEDAPTEPALRDPSRPEGPRS